MLKKLLLGLCFLLIATQAQAINTNDAISSNSVSFNVVALVVTFNTIVNEILVINEDAASTVWVTYTGLGWSYDGTAYLNPAVGSLTATASSVRILPSSSLSLEIGTDIIGFITNAGEGTVSYLATADTGTQP